jgi:hypothetical protein
MRVAILSAVVAVLLLSGSAHAQEWINYEDRAWGFSINFPHEPKMEQIDYRTFFGQTVPARVYSAERESGRYSLTVVYFAGAPTDSHTAVSYAAEAIRDKGKVTYYAFDSLDGIPGQMITTTQPDGRLIQASVYFVDQRLYIAEGSVAAGSAAPAQFHQSIRIVDPEGNPIVLEPN